MKLLIYAVTVQKPANIRMKNQTGRQISIVVYDIGIEIVEKDGMNRRK